MKRDVSSVFDSGNTEKSPHGLQKGKTAMIKCDYCGKPGAKINHVSRSYGKAAELLVIEDIPVIACPHCKETYMTAETMHEIERIRLHRKSMAKKRQLAVVEFA